MAEAVNRPSYQSVDSKVEIMDTPYDRWIASQGIDIVRGFFVEDLYTTPLKWWDRIGGNGVWGEFFQGRIDEVRIYNRALSAAEVQTDMNTAVQP